MFFVRIPGMYLYMVPVRDVHKFSPIRQTVHTMHDQQSSLQYLHTCPLSSSALFDALEAVCTEARNMCAPSSYI
jgi:hypothetical protein